MGALLRKIPIFVLAAFIAAASGCNKTASQPESGSVVPDGNGPPAATDVDLGEPQSESEDQPQGIAAASAQETNGTDAAADSDADSDADRAVTVRLVNPDELQAELERHRGKVVVVDYWATWCLPCVEDLPETVAWTGKFPRDELTVVTFSLDEVKNRKQVIELLTEMGAEETVNLQSALGGSQRAFEAFDVMAPPQYRIYNREGQLAREFYVTPDDYFEHSDVEQALRETLGVEGEEDQPSG